MFPNVKLKSWKIGNYTKMHISYKNRLLWQIKEIHPLAAIIYIRFTYPWRFTRVPSVVMGTSNQVHQLKLLQKITQMKNSEFCEDMSKSKNANRVSLIIHLWLKYLSFWVELCKTLERDGQEIKISTCMKKFHFWVKYTVFIKNENEVLKNLIFATHGLMTIFNTWSKF